MTALLSFWIHHHLWVQFTKIRLAVRYSRFTIAKDIISRMNNTMPEMEIQGTLQRFGYGFLDKGKLTEAVYGPTTYSRSDMEYALQSIITPGGT